MRSTNIDELEFYICDIGMSATLKLLHLTEKQANLILNPEPVGEAVRVNLSVKEYNPLKPPTSDNAIRLCRFLSDKYKQLRRDVVKNRLVINARCLTTEDIFHNHLLDLLKKADSFQHKDSEQTKHFVLRSYKRDKIDEERKCNSLRVNMKKYRSIVEMSPNYKVSSKIID